MLEKNVAPISLRISHLSSIVLANRTFAASRGTGLSLLLRCGCDIWYSAIQNPPWLLLEMPTQNQLFSIGVSSSSSPISRASTNRSSSLATADTSWYLCRLSNHLAPSCSNCWQKWSSASWSGSRRGLGWTGSRPRRSISMAVARSSTIRPPRDGQAHKETER